MSIEISNLTKRFKATPDAPDGVVALDGISLSIQSGEFFGLLGPNGAGKTTLIKILCSIIEPTEGEAYIDGIPLADEAAVKRHVAYVSGDSRTIYWRLTGRQNLTFFAALNDLPRSSAQARIDELLELVGLSDFADRKVMTYSTGMKMRLDIARALLGDPAVLLVDELFAPLDPIITKQLRDFILALKGEKTVIFATHDMQEVKRLCDRIGLLSAGKLVWAGGFGEVLTQLGIASALDIHLSAVSPEVVRQVEQLPDVKYASSVGQVLRVALNNQNLNQVLQTVSSNGSRVLSVNTSDFLEELINVKSTELAEN